eukprot:scaffold111612_cov68-Phaeocystis_antarctica.AAC.3
MARFGRKWRRAWHASPAPEGARGGTEVRPASASLGPSGWPAMPGGALDLEAHAQFGWAEGDVDGRGGDEDGPGEGAGEGEG